MFVRLQYHGRNKEKDSSRNDQQSFSRSSQNWKHDLENIQLHDEAIRNIMRIFKKFSADKYWKTNVMNLNESKSYLKTEVFKNLQLTNDVAERKIALIQKLNNKTTHDENNFNFLDKLFL